ncbi:MAG TPA: hypothetical protein VGX96_04165 [Candidatus Elarobacter sp.]|nr:hypothetical protein [Candidatus Elarobacter sp.]
MEERSRCESVESLNALDLDIEALEQRLDMVVGVTALGYVCVGDVTVVTTVCSPNGGQPPTKPH